MDGMMTRKPLSPIWGKSSTEGKAATDFLFAQMRLWPSSHPPWAKAARPTGVLGMGLLAAHPGGLD